MEYGFSVGAFRSLKTLSNIVIVILLTMAVCSLLVVFFGFSVVLFPEKFVEFDSGGPIQILMMLVGLVDFVHLWCFIGTVITFLMWKHRAFTNLPILGNDNNEFSPGWAVGWWFIPFANLVKPFQAMRELWNGSDPEYDPEYGFLSSVGGAPTIMGFWWASWILFNVSSNITQKMEGLDIMPIAMIVSKSIEIVAAVLLAMIVNDIRKRQELRFERIGSKAISEPPPPPTFEQI